MHICIHNIAEITRHADLSHTCKVRAQVFFIQQVHMSVALQCGNAVSALNSMGSAHPPYAGRADF